MIHLLASSLRIALLVACIFSFTFATNLPAADSLSKQPAKVREQRIEFQQQAEADVAKPAQAVADTVKDLIEAATKNRITGQIEDITRLIDGLSRLDEEMAGRYVKSFATSLPHQKRCIASAKKRWQRSLDKRGVPLFLL